MKRKSTKTVNFPEKEKTNNGQLDAAAINNRICEVQGRTSDFTEEHRTQVQQLVEGLLHRGVVTVKAFMRYRPGRSIKPKQFCSMSLAQGSYSLVIIALPAYSAHVGLAVHNCGMRYSSRPPNMGTNTP